MTWEALKIGLQINEKYGILAAGLLTSLVMFWPGIKARVSKSFGKSLPAQMNVDAKVNSLLDLLIRDLQCERAYVSLYHNGQANALGNHFARVSCTHERTFNVPPVMASMKNLQNSMFAHWNTDFQKMKEIGYPDISVLKEHDFGLHFALHQRGVRSCYLVGLWDGNQIPLGFVSIEFCRSTTSLSQRDKDQLKAVSMKICGLIMSGNGRRK